MIGNFVIEDNNKRNDLYSRLLEDRVVLVYGEITDELALSITSQLLYLDSKNNKDIHMYINSPGGSVSAGLSILDTMNLIKSDVSTICLGIGASMGAILTAGGKKGKRYITPNGEIMLHQPSGGSQGQESDMRINVERLSRLRNKLENYLSLWTGKSIETINRDCERDKWLVAEEAIKYGLVDKILVTQNETKGE